MLKIVEEHKRSHYRIYQLCYNSWVLKVKISDPPVVIFLPQRVGITSPACYLKPRPPGFLPCHYMVAPLWAQLTETGQAPSCTPPTHVHPPTSLPSGSHNLAAWFYLLIQQTFMFRQKFKEWAHPFSETSPFTSALGFLCAVSQTFSVSGQFITQVMTLVIMTMKINSNHDQCLVT